MHPAPVIPTEAAGGQYAIPPAPVISTEAPWGQYAIPPAPAIPPEAATSGENPDNQVAATNGGENQGNKVLPEEPEEIFAHLYQTEDGFVARQGPSPEVQKHVEDLVEELESQYVLWQQLAGEHAQLPVTERLGDLKDAIVRLETFDGMFEYESEYNVTKKRDFDFPWVAKSNNVSCCFSNFAWWNLLCLCADNFSFLLLLQPKPVPDQPSSGGFAGQRRDPPTQRPDPPTSPPPPRQRDSDDHHTPRSARTRPRSSSKGPQTPPSYR